METKYQVDIKSINNTLNFFSNCSDQKAKELVELLNYSQSVINNELELLDKLQLIEDLSELETDKNAFLVIILDYLIASIEAYQACEQTTPNQVLAKLMKQANVKQKELSHIVPQSIISELVNGKRQLTLRHIQCFAEFFNVPVSYFLKNE
ncbi:helix-turn-helix domain-containing protein [Catenovulum sp. 2E275]|uniref:helix-turn-helix domain-containing protein n=1 Tax=Catenovulum sp. 2E275 TaxID=2980497 RepID=UPI0021CE150C|nr:helix-turn-helix domain-containing protein [Catenovulum sp. 2E275]MCU4675821.1 helix-turn-helix domain-containing protein [Catenovulum sp. 2E275]